MAETSSLLNCRTGYRTGGSNPPASAYFAWRFRLVARTHASHAWNTGSIPVGATKKLKAEEYKNSRHLENMALSSSG